MTLEFTDPITLEQYKLVYERFTLFLDYNMGKGAKIWKVCADTEGKRLATIQLIDGKWKLINKVRI